jgi:diacylglycerol O-acyltransferase / wax synthase
MAQDRLSALDASFLQVESTRAHMHVGWAALFRPRGEGPSFETVRDHVAGRLARAPRYRQRLARVPLGVGNPVWVDDERFDVDRHVLDAGAMRFPELLDLVMSTPLAPDRPLWELWIARDAGDGALGVVGKAHHCMVDGVAAVELATLLLDPTPEPPPAERDGWRPSPTPGALGLAAAAVRERLGAAASLALAPARLAAAPERALDLPRAALRAGRALLGAVAPAAPTATLNSPISPRRHLARATRPLEDLRRVKRSFGTTINDVLLATAAGALRRFLEERGEQPRPLKAMVPVSVRTDRERSELGNRISFVFAELPCHEPDPVARLHAAHRAMETRKEAGEPEGADDLMRLAGYAPLAVQRALSRLVASPLVFNLTVSNIPGPRQPMYMLGCELEEAYPVVPIADRHGVSIGMTTIGEKALFGVYADRETVPDSESLACGLEEALDELLDRAGYVSGAEWTPSGTRSSSPSTAAR